MSQYASMADFGPSTNFPFVVSSATVAEYVASTLMNTYAMSSLETAT